MFIKSDFTGDLCAVLTSDVHKGGGQGGQSPPLVAQLLKNVL